MAENFGLSQSCIDVIAKTKRDFAQIEDIVIFGSRALGRHRPGSDVDLALKGTALTFDDVARFAAILNEETTQPYFFDVIHYDAISSAELLQHLDTYGKRLA